MAQMAKLHMAIPEQTLRELAMIEAETDRPRTRILRRAVEEYLTRYRAANPDFARRAEESIGKIIQERELKPGLNLDNVVIKGQKMQVIITEDGWRKPTDDDYVGSGDSILEG